MDVFTPKTGAHGADVIFCVSGGWYSDRNAITGNVPLWVGPLVAKGYTVSAVCHGSKQALSADGDGAVRLWKESAEPTSARGVGDAKGK